MADLSVTPVSTGIKPQQQMSLGDLMNIASSAQAYQQAQQLNPLAVQKATADVQSAQQTAQGGAVDLQQKQTGFKEAQAIQQAIASNPDQFMTNGKFDTAKLNKVIPQIAPLTAAEQIDRYTKVANSQAQADTAKLGLTKDQKSIFGSTISALGYAGIDDPNKYIQAIDNITKAHGNDKDMTDLAAAYKNILGLSTPGAHISNAAVQLGQSLMTQPEQAAAFRPTAEAQDIGGKLLKTQKTPSVAGQAPKLEVTGELSGKTLAPQVFANPITGQPTVLGGGGANVNRAGGGAAPVAPAGVPSNIVGGQGAAAMPQGGGQLAQQPNESPANFNARVAQTQSLYSSALDQYNNPNSAAGHIPTAQNLNNNILNLLKDPKVNTGSIADYLANKTNKGALNPKEQELTKYLEQRIQGLAPRSDADAISMKNAFGSFNLDKEALKDIVRNDNAFVTSRDLLAKGILHNGANPLNPNNPNYGNVSNFVNKFTPYSSDPTLMKYISIVGEKQKAKIDDDDKNALAKVIGRLSPAERSALEAKRQELLQLVNGGR